MIAYPCKTCGTEINWPTTDSSCSNLLKHAAACIKRHSEGGGSHSLASLGITGTGEIDSREVTQMCAIWCAESARPFSVFEDPSLKTLLHPTVLKNLPNRQLLSKAIHQLYTAVQENLRSEMKSRTGALYLGVDAWQSPNGYDILGVVIYRLRIWDGGNHNFEALPLDFVKLSHSHTGEYLAETLQLIVEKFEIQNKINGIVLDNASNNMVMIKELKKLKWPNFKGEAHWIRCFAHVLNLIVKAILRQFGPKKRKSHGTGELDDQREDVSDVSDNDLDETEEDSDKQIQLYPRGQDLSDSGGEEGSPEDEHRFVEKAADQVDLDLNDIDDLSEEDEDDQYTSKICQQTLSKFRMIARKLNKSPNSKALFVELCEENSCGKPHNIEQDVSTRWNSTLLQLNGIFRCHSAISEWQPDKKY
ncbi:hypothetical protein PTTG_05393 [Puccinia triticina 1-1 BBBD Race 1]|uniref:DUF659 domain-containing protein n=1 Tax=Puccinia triticina (isolate 1-1 / race 1 (BBBD)) TaxID=630390 RepID=A0A180GH76_PUCT1|nr:hypothetical protein PTTG_05393 [Puccinia triticina 1-1 BBBD Race 1]